MSDRISDYTTIPKAPYYVFATDDSHINGPKTEVLVFPCASFAEARIVKTNCDNRTDIADFVRIVEFPPVPSLSIQHWLMEKNECPIWYEVDGIPFKASQRHNGYANIATYNVSLVIDNDHFYTITARAIVKDDPSGETLKHFVLRESRIPNSLFDQQFANERSLLDLVDWKELANDIANPTP